MELSGRVKTVTDIFFARGGKYMCRFELPAEFMEADLEPRYDLRDYDWMSAYLYKEYLPDDFAKGISFIIDMNGESTEAMRTLKETGTLVSARVTARGDSARVKMNSKLYGGQVLYFCNMPMGEGFWENNCFCVMYPARLVGTPEEERILGILERAVETYTEKK